MLPGKANWPLELLRATRGVAAEGKVSVVAPTGTFEEDRQAAGAEAKSPPDAGEDGVPSGFGRKESFDVIWALDFREVDVENEIRGP
jgi:hypothetical protein